MSIFRNVTRYREEIRELKGKLTDAVSLNFSLRSLKELYLNQNTALHTETVVLMKKLRAAEASVKNLARENMIFAGKLEEEYLLREEWRRKAETYKRLLGEYNAEIEELRAASCSMSALALRKKQERPSAAVLANRIVPADLLSEQVKVDMLRMDVV